MPEMWAPTRKDNGMSKHHVILTKSRYDGDVYDPKRDDVRLGRQLWDIWEIMRHGRSRWWTLHELQVATGHPQASISAQLRHLRKDRFGNHEILKRRRMNGNEWEYLLIPNQEYSLVE